MKIILDNLIDSNTGEKLIIDLPEDTNIEDLQSFRVKAWESGAMFRAGLMGKTLRYNNDMSNSVFVLYPKRSTFGIWAFDDEMRGLKNEPFVGETNNLLDKMAIESGYDLNDNPQVALLFAATEFPDYQCDLNLIETSPTGTTYRDQISGIYPWLCPAMFKYFPEAPEKMYGAVVSSKYGL
jgi:hypothetical protein